MERTAIDLWNASADAWIKGQGEEGDYSRRVILDPALASWLAQVSGKSVLDVGCGEGRYSRKMKAAGADVWSLDPSDKLVQYAQSKDPDGRYAVGMAEELPYADNQFDVVLSYLSIIDIEGLDAATAEMVRVLRPGGEIVVVTLSNLASTSEGWVKDSYGKKLYRTVDRYMEHFSMDLEWSGMKIRNFHRPLSDILRGFLSRGCVLTDFQEPLPPKNSSSYVDEFRAPNFQIMRLRKLADGG